MMYPSVTIALRVWHGARLTLHEMFLPGYTRFWPNKCLWENSNLVLIWDEESEKDRESAQWLHEKWDKRISDARRCNSNQITGSSGAIISLERIEPGWIDLFESPGDYLCGRATCPWPARSLGYRRQLSTYFTWDHLLKDVNPGKNLMSDIPMDNQHFIGIMDSDMVFTTAVHPRELFDTITRKTDNNGITEFLPIVSSHNVRCEPERALEGLPLQRPPVLCAMDLFRFPWLVNIDHIKLYRETFVRSIFSKLPRFLAPDDSRSARSRKAFECSEASRISKVRAMDRIRHNIVGDNGEIVGKLVLDRAELKILEELEEKLKRNGKLKGSIKEGNLKESEETSTDDRSNAPDTEKKDSSDDSSSTVDNISNKYMSEKGSGGSGSGAVFLSDGVEADSDFSIAAKNLDCKAYKMGMENYDSNTTTVIKPTVVGGNDQHFDSDGKRVLSQAEGDGNRIISPAKQEKLSKLWEQLRGINTLKSEELLKFVKLSEENEELLLGDGSNTNSPQAMKFLELLRGKRLGWSASWTVNKDTSNGNQEIPIETRFLTARNETRDQFWRGTIDFERDMTYWDEVVLPENSPNRKYKDLKLLGRPFTINTALQLFWRCHPLQFRAVCAADVFSPGHMFNVLWYLPGIREKYGWYIRDDSVGSYPDRQVYDWAVGKTNDVDVLSVDDRVDLVDSVLGDISRNLKSKLIMDGDRAIRVDLTGTGKGSDGTAVTISDKSIANDSNSSNPRKRLKHILGNSKSRVKLFVEKFLKTPLRYDSKLWIYTLDTRHYNGVQFTKKVYAPDDPLSKESQEYTTDDDRVLIPNPKIGISQLPLVGGGFSRREADRIERNLAEGVKDWGQCRFGGNFGEYLAVMQEESEGRPVSTEIVKLQNEIPAENPFLSGLRKELMNHYLGTASAEQAKDEVLKSRRLTQNKDTDPAGKTLSPNHLTEKEASDLAISSLTSENALHHHQAIKSGLFNERLTNRTRYVVDLAHHDASRKIPKVVIPVLHSLHVHQSLIDLLKLVLLNGVEILADKLWHDRQIEMSKRDSKGEFINGRGPGGKPEVLGEGRPVIPNFVLSNKDISGSEAPGNVHNIVRIANDLIPEEGEMDVENGLKIKSGLDEATSSSSKKIVTYGISSSKVQENIILEGLTKVPSDGSYGRLSGFNNTGHYSRAPIGEQELNKQHPPWLYELRINLFTYLKKLIEESRLSGEGELVLKGNETFFKQFTGGERTKIIEGSKITASKMVPEKPTTMEAKNNRNNLLNKLLTSSGELDERTARFTIKLQHSHFCLYSDLLKNSIDKRYCNGLSGNHLSRLSGKGVDEEFSKPFGPVEGLQFYQVDPRQDRDRTSKKSGIGVGIAYHFSVRANIFRNELSEIQRYTLLDPPSEAKKMIKEINDYDSSSKENPKISTVTVDSNSGETTESSTIHQSTHYSQLRIDAYSTQNLRQSSARREIPDELLDTASLLDPHESSDLLTDENAKQINLPASELSNPLVQMFTPASVARLFGGNAQADESIGENYFLGKALDFIGSQPRMLSPTDVDMGLVSNPMRLFESDIEHLAVEKRIELAHKYGVKVDQLDSLLHDKKDVLLEAEKEVYKKYKGGDAGATESEIIDYKHKVVSVLEPPEFLGYHEKTTYELPQSSFYKSLKRNWRMIFLFSRFFRRNNPYLAYFCYTQAHSHVIREHVNRDRCPQVNLWRAMNETYFHMEAVYRDRHGWNWMT